MQEPAQDKQPPVAQKRERVSFWRLGLGLLLFLGGLKNLLSKPVGELQPSNESEWVGYYLFCLLLLLFGVIFVFLGARLLWRKSGNT